MTVHRQSPQSGREKDDLVPESLEHAWRNLDDPEPPDLVDQGVLNRARAAVEGSRTGRPWSFGWIHTLTTAAVIALGVTLLLQLGEQTAPPDLPTQAVPSPATIDIEKSETDLRTRSARNASEAESKRLAPVSAERQSQAVATPLAEQADTLADEVVRTPDAWLADIRALVDEGQIDEARKSLAAFREAWPDHPVPDDLLP